MAILEMINVYDQGTPCHTAATIAPRRSVSSRLPANFASRSNFWKKTVVGSLPIFISFIPFLWTSSTAGSRNIALNSWTKLSQ